MDAPTDFWNARYAQYGYVFGTAPNDFLKECVHMLKPGRVLSLGEGEGRNAVWLAERGYDAHGIDLSPVAVEKAARFAAERKVDVDFRVADLERLTLIPEAWDVIVSIFVHTPPPVRAHVHREVQRGLKPGGHYIMEAYGPAQVGRGTGGPQSIDMLVALDDARRELAGMEFLIAEELEREVVEGGAHTGMAAVTQVLARKP